MSEMPTLGTTETKSPLVPVALVACLVGTLSGTAWWLTHREAQAAVPEPVAAAEAPATPPLPAVDAPPAPVNPTAAPTPTAPAPSGPALAAAPTSAATTPRPAGGLRTLSATIAGPLESAIVAQVGKDVGQPLTQVVNRSLVWWMKVPGDLLKGDVLTAVYEERAGQEPLVHAVRYSSRKFGKTFEAFRFQGAGEAHARFFQPDGTTLEEQLVGGPIEDYEQITSLLRDGRGHKGVDFKAPVGTPVKATFDGIITRKNWSFRGNGNSLEIEEAGGQGRTALYLHLSELPKSVQVGARVKKGQVLAQSGNSGRSFAPHLHYQLMKGGTVVDPFKSHPTSRESVPSGDRAAFEAKVASLKALLPADAVAGN
jgi:murein DD-endopeptidase MepM/ murein hydrolase activator NlpD